MPTAIRVSVGILTQNGHLFICQRRGSDMHPLQWEFPGGKAHETEDDGTCLHRELYEELAIDATIGTVLQQATFTYPNGRTVALTFFHVPRYHGEIQNRQFHAVKWVVPSELPTYDFLAGDREFVAALACGEWAFIFSDS